MIAPIISAALPTRMLTQAWWQHEKGDGGPVSEIRRINCENQLEQESYEEIAMSPS